MERYSSLLMQLKSISTSEDFNRHSNLCENLALLSTPNEEIIKKVEADIQIVLPIILTLSVHEDIKIRQSVISILDTLTQVVSKNPSLKKQEWWKKMETSVISQRLGPRMKQMVEENEETWVSIWCFTAKLIVSEDQVHSVAINCLLKIVELAFKISRKNDGGMEKAFTCWNQLISLFSLYPRIMSSQKLVELLVRPLATNLYFKQPGLKMQTWEHLMNKIGYFCGSKCQAVTGPFLDFMYFKGENSLCTVFPVECAKALQEMTAHKNVYKYYASKLVSAFPLCVQSGDPLQMEEHILSIWTGILENMNHVDVKDYCLYVFSVLFSCLHEVVKNCNQPELASKLLKKTIDMQVFTVKILKICLQESSIVSVLTDFMEIQDFREVAFASVVNELLNIFSDCNGKKEGGKDDLDVWDLLCEVYVSWMKAQDGAATVNPHTLTSLLLIPLLSKQWSGAVQKMWIGVVELTQISCPQLDYIPGLLAKVHTFLERGQISGPLVLEIANNLTSRNKEVFKIIFPTIVMISKHLPEKDAKPLLDLLVLLEYTLSYIPKSDLSKFLRDLMANCNTYGQPYDLRIKTKIVKLQRKMYSIKDPVDTAKEENGKSNTSNGKETEGKEPQQNGQKVRSPLIAQSNFLQRLARAEEKKSKLKTSMSTVFGEMLGHETPSSPGDSTSVPRELTPAQNGTNVEVQDNNVENGIEKTVDDCDGNDLACSNIDKESKGSLNESNKMRWDESTKMDKEEPIKMDTDESVKVNEANKMDTDESTNVNLSELPKKEVGVAMMGLTVSRPGEPAIPSRVTVCTPVRGRRKSKSPEPRAYQRSLKSPRAHLTSSISRTPPPAYFTEDAQDLPIVVVPAKPKTTPLTEHQKEVLSKRRSDIPALYQDLSQDTQTMDSSSLKEIITVHKTESKKEENENKENSENIVPKVKLIIEDVNIPSQESAKDILTEKKQKEISNVIENSDKINVDDDIIENTPDIVPSATNVDLTPTKRLSATPKNLFSSTLFADGNVSDDKTIQKVEDEVEKENKVAIDSKPQANVVRRRTGRRSACKLTPKFEEVKSIAKSKKDLSESVALAKTDDSKTKEEETKFNESKISSKKVEEAIASTKKELVEVEVADTSVTGKEEPESQKSEGSVEKSASSTVELSDKIVCSVDASTVPKSRNEIDLVLKTDEKVTQESNVDNAPTGKEEQVTDSKAITAISQEVESSQDSQSPTGWSMTTPEREKKTRKPRSTPVFSPKQLRSKRLSLQKGTGTTPIPSGKKKATVVVKQLLAGDKPESEPGKQDDNTEVRTESVETKDEVDKKPVEKALVSVVKTDIAEDIEKPKRKGRKRKTDIPSEEVEEKKKRVEVQSEPNKLTDSPEANKSIIEQKKRNSKLTSNNLENWVIKTGKSVVKSPEVELKLGPTIVNVGEPEVVVNDIKIGEFEVIVNDVSTGEAGVITNDVKVGEPEVVVNNVVMAKPEVIMNDVKIGAPEVIVNDVSMAEPEVIVKDAKFGEPEIFVNDINVEINVSPDTLETKSTEEDLENRNSIFEKSMIVEISNASTDESLNFGLNSGNQLNMSYTDDIPLAKNEEIQTEDLKCDENEVAIQIDRDKVEEDKSRTMSRRRKRRLGVGDVGGAQEEEVEGKRERVVTPYRAGRGAHMLRLAAGPEEDQPALKTTPVRRKSLAHPIHLTENWPEGRKEDWVPFMPTPPAFSSPGILKRKLLSAQTSPLPSPTSSANRKKRVSFLDPPVSKGLLYASGGLGEVQHADVRPVRLFEMEEEAECPVMPSPIKNVTEESGAMGGAVRLEVVEDELTAIQEFLNSTPTSWSEDHLASIRGLVHCDHPVDSIIPRIVETSGREKQLSEELKKLKIRSMKDFCSLSREEIQTLSIRPSKFNTLHTVLSEHLDSCRQNSGSDDDLVLLKDALMVEKEVDATLETADSSMQTDCTEISEVRSVHTMCDPPEMRDSCTDMDKTTRRETLIDTIKEWTKDELFLSLLRKDSQIVGSLARDGQFVETVAQHLDLQQLGHLLIAKHKQSVQEPLVHINQT